jgi:hypothetical protein
MRVLLWLRQMASAGGKISNVTGSWFLGNLRKSRRALSDADIKSLSALSCLTGCLSWSDALPTVTRRNGDVASQNYYMRHWLKHLRFDRVSVLKGSFGDVFAEDFPILCY